MNRSIAATTVALALLAVPAGAVAKPAQADRSNATQECRAERGGSDATREAFKVKYGTNENGRNAFGKCVSAKARAEARERKAARRKAAKQCRAEREEIGETAFAEKYGTNKSKRNAFGKCVSQTAKTQHEQEQQPAPTS
ncbi:MAG TPA: hypothetical protein VHF88_10235 [Thermoleophilaceae bacterium]|nr:hypothetical protein [Thermoleophilaceae bacterium]